MFVRTAWILWLMLFLNACSSSKHAAPIVNITAATSANVSHGAAGTYTVKAGENLYRIALENGVAYRDLAAWNNITDVNDIKAGQVLRINSADNNKTGVVINSIPGSTPVITKPLSPTTGNVRPQAMTSTPLDQVPLTEEDAIAMSWPTHGPLLVSFAKNGKGIDIGGKVGQPILAAADGTVVYSGNGLRSYGKMIILKHNKTYLTAYAHNNKLLVKEGDRVKREQKIAEMGNTEAESVKLHFEVRRFGKPVDPTKYLTN